METKLVKNELQSIYGGLQMLSENKEESLSALAEISIILSSSRVTEYYQISEEVSPFLASIHFLLKGLTKESISLVQKIIDNASNIEVDTIDYKTKYEETLVALVATQERLLQQSK